MRDTIAAIWDTILAIFHFIAPIGDFIVATKVPEQLEQIKYMELISNPWFIVPYLLWLAWILYKRQFNNFIIVVLLSGSWVFFGTPFMRGVMAQDEIQLDTIIPLVGGACLVLGIIVYLVFFKQE